MIIYTSKSDYCSDSSDGSMFLNMKLYRKINTKDTIVIDGGCTLFVEQFVDLSTSKNYKFTDDNFVYPCCIQHILFMKILFVILIIKV